MKLLELDGTDNKGRLGANAILGCSLAAARVAANTLGILCIDILEEAIHIVCLFHF